jgi:hypothetical protein
MTCSPPRSYPFSSMARPGKRNSPPRDGTSRRSPRSCRPPPRTWCCPRVRHRDAAHNRTSDAEHMGQDLASPHFSLSPEEARASNASRMGLRLTSYCEIPAMCESEFALLWGALTKAAEAGANGVKLPPRSEPSGGMANAQTRALGRLMRRRGAARVESRSEVAEPAGLGCEISAATITGGEKENGGPGYGGRYNAPKRDL